MNPAPRLLNSAASSRSISPPALPRVSGGCTPVLSRRHALQIGGLGLMGLSLPQLLQAAAGSSVAGRRSAPAENCIVLFLNGGPSHLDMWDMKPEAPEGIRGEFRPIASSLPSAPVCELLPGLARHMHRATLIRSMHHSVNNAHALAVYTAMTGHDRGDANRIVGNSPEDHPSIGSVLARMHPPRQAVVPYVSLPYLTKEGAGGPPQPGFFGGLIGQAYDPLFVLKDPNADDFAAPELTLTADVSHTRLEARRALFASLDRRLEAASRAGSLAAMNAFQQQALELLTSPVTQQAFRIQDEADDIRQKYGRNIYGQSVLLARRLIEAGTRCVTISWAPDANATWDTHGQNFKKLRETLLPQFDAAFASLIDDLHDRGMLDRTLVAVLGDFGRTPKVNGNAGRDHWNYCYSVLLIGGGVRPGYIHGASDATGAFPARDPVTPAELVTTMYSLLGVPPETELYDALDRPHRLVPGGQVIPQLLA